jgi:hypothetical protein
MPYTLAVGEPFIPGRTNWPEGARFSYFESGHLLAVFLRSPSAAEVRGFGDDEAHVGMFVYGPVIFVLAKFGQATGWMDAPYSIHLGGPSALPKKQTAFTIALVDATTGLVQGLRVATLGDDFIDPLHRRITAQAMQAFDPTAYDAAIREAYEQFTIEAMVKRAEVLVTVQGVG